MDENGVPTTDPALALKGVLLPVAGHKGYSLALIVETLGGVLSGSEFSMSIKPTYNFTDARGLGHFFMAIDLEMFLSLEEYSQRMDELKKRVKDTPLMKGTERIYFPGERTFIKRRRIKMAYLFYPQQ
ncbi:MAG: Ldh family oxidoreductase [Peptococcaceae bacterium]